MTKWKTKCFGLWSAHNFATVARLALCVWPALSSVPLLAEGQPNKPNDVTAEVTPHGDVQANPPAADRERVWIISIRLRGRILLAEDVFAYGVAEGDEVYLPASELFDALGFPITFDPATRQLSGWFLRENQTFSFDARTRVGSVAGRNVTLPPGRVLEDGKTIYLPLSALSDWLQLGADWVAAEQTVTFQPTYLIPAEERAQRADDAGRAGGRGPALDLSVLPRAYGDYAWISWPHGELTASANLSDSGNGRGAFYQSSAVLRGDLLKSSATAFVNVGSRLNATGRLTLSRTDPDGRLLGPFGASQVEAGDIALSPVPLLQRAAAGTGIRIASTQTASAGNFDVFTFEGAGLPGWQVKFYRSGELLGFQTIGDDGRYLFEEIPLLFGENVLTAELYGPQGQRDTDTRVIQVDGGLVRPGRLDYTFEAIDADRTVLGRNLDLSSGFGESSRSGGGEENDPMGARLGNGRGGQRAQLRLGYGLSRRATLRGTLGWQNRRTDGQTILAGAGATMSTDRWLAEIDVLGSSDGGSGFAMGGSGRAMGLNLNVRREAFSEAFATNANEGFGDTGRISSRTAIGVNTQLPFRVPLSMTVSAGRTMRFDGGRSDTGSFRLSASGSGISASQAINYQNFLAPGLESDARWTGLSTVSAGFRGLRGRLGLSYDLAPESDARRADILATTRVGAWNVDGRWSRDLMSTTSDYGVGVSRDVGGVRLGLDARYNDGFGQTQILATLSAAIDKHPVRARPRLGETARSRRGTLRIQAFDDADRDGLRSGTEPMLPITAVIAEPRGQATPLSDGSVLIENLPVGEHVGVALDTGLLADPFAIPGTPGAAVLARPGRILSITLPVVQSAEIELVVEDGKGEPVEGARATLHACAAPGDAPHVYRTRSAYDGFVLFQLVRPGCYELRINGLKIDQFEPVPGQVVVGDRVVLESRH